MSNQFAIGADPEIFVADQSGLRSIIGTIGGTKENPRPLMELGDGFAVQEDNVALEFNIPASRSRADFIHNILTAREFLNSLVQDSFGLHLVNTSAAEFPAEELTHPKALEFGCDPDFNAWTRRKNPRPKADSAALRSCGGHVHIGYQFKDKDQALEAIRGMDLMLGVPSILMDRGELRKKLYGKAGAFRYKPYGVEYRTLSNFWVFDEKLIGWVYDNTAKVLNAVQSGDSFLQYADVITSCINNNDKDLAAKLVQQFNLEVVNA